LVPHLTIVFLDGAGIVIKAEQQQDNNNYNYHRSAISSEATK